MKLFTAAQERAMRLNDMRRHWHPDDGNPFKPIKPVVKLFTPDGAATWLLSELSQDGDTAYGLCDLGLGCVELGYVDMNELRALRGKFGLPVERDKWFKADRTLAEYWREASASGTIAGIA